VKLGEGKGQDAVDGYFHLWAFNYTKGDVLAEVLDEEELEAHQILTRIMFNLRKEGLTPHVDWGILKIDGELHSENPTMILQNFESVSNYINEPSAFTSSTLSPYDAYKSAREGAISLLAHLEL